VSKYRDGAVVRRERLRRIVAFVHQNPGVLIDRIQAHVSWNIGLSPKTTARYVRELVEVGLLVEDGQGFKAAKKM